MAELNDLSRGKQIRNLLFVFGGGMGAALLFAIAMLYFYNPSGSYLARNMLLSPENAFAMHYTELNPKAGASSRFVFDSLEFSYYSSDLKKWKRFSISLQKYKVLYATIDDDRSLGDADEKIKSLFDMTSKPSTLSMKVKPESDSSGHGAAKTFLTLDFAAEGNYYRIGLREHGSQDGWAYFYHPGIYQKVLKLIISE